MMVLLDLVMSILDLGGPVVLVLAAISVVALSITFYKLWQFQVAGVGRHHALREAVHAWDIGEKSTAAAALSRSKSYLVPVVKMATEAENPTRERLEAEAETKFAALESGLRVLDMIAQLAPLLGLFGTVLGMIEAFQALQDAGSQVDPSILAGGIWVALLTTAVGLAVAMPASILHSWFDTRMEAERVMAEHAIESILSPQGSKSPEAPVSGLSYAPA